MGNHKDSNTEQSKSIRAENKNRTDGCHPDQKIRISQSEYNSSHQRRTWTIN